MSAKEIFREGMHSYLCHVVETPAGVFSCAVIFRSDLGRDPATTNLRLNAVFRNAEIAMGVGENYGRALIRKHGDVVRYLASNTNPES